MSAQNVSKRGSGRESLDVRWKKHRLLELYQVGVVFAINHPILSGIFVSIDHSGGEGIFVTLFNFILVICMSMSNLSQLFYGWFGGKESLPHRASGGELRWQLLQIKSVLIVHLASWPSFSHL